MAWSPLRRFVPDSAIKRRMDQKDARINRELRAKLDRALDAKRLREAVAAYNAKAEGK